MLKIIYILLLSIFATTSYGSVSKLLNPGKNTVITDVGYKDGSAHIAKPVPKTLQDIPALSRMIDNSIILKQRDIASYDCSVDQYGNMACPQEQVDCTGNLITQAGTSTLHNGTAYMNKIPNLCSSVSKTAIATVGGGALNGSNSINISQTVTLQPTESLYATTDPDFAACDDDSTRFFGSYSGYKTGSFSYGCPTGRNGHSEFIAKNTTSNPVSVTISMSQQHSGGGWDYSRIHLDKGTCVAGVDASYSFNDPRVGYPWGNILQTYGVAVGNKTHNFFAQVAGTYTFNLMIDNYGSMSVDGTQILYGDYWPTLYSTTLELTQGVHTININGANISDVAGQAGTIEFNGAVIWNSHTGQASVPEYICPNHSVWDGTGCKIDYTYYTYTCPVAPLTEQAWVGPLTAGGDCAGININDNKECNSPTPPANNCNQTNYTCPIGDERNECSKTASTTSLAQNLFDGYKYAPGDAVNHTEVKITPRLCKGKVQDCASISSAYIDNPDNDGECIAPLEFSEHPDNLSATYIIPRTFGSALASPYPMNGTVLSGTVPTLSGATLFTTKNWQLNGKLTFQIFNYGDGLGGIKLNPKPDNIMIMQDGGSSVGGYTTNNFAAPQDIFNSWDIVSTHNQYASALVSYNTLPTNITFECDDYCMVGGPTEPIGFTNWHCDQALGYKWSSELNACYLDKSGQTENLTTQMYVASKNTGFNEANDMCEGDKISTCSQPGYVFNEAIGECVGDYVCPGYWNASKGLCEVAPKITCEAGYQYNVATMRCESQAFCNGTTLNNVTFKCEAESICKSGWSQDITSGECTKPLETVNPICVESWMTWDQTLHLCSGSANFADWHEVDPWGTGTWTVQASNKLYQSENGPYPTFYLSTKDYGSTILKGKVSISSASGDNDSVGIAFGYKNNAQYFLLNWEKDHSGNSGGSYLMSLQQINGGAPRNHGGTGGTTLGGINTGWSYNTTYDMEVRATSNSASIFLNGALQFTVDNLVVPATGKIGFYNQSQNLVTYSDFVITTIPTCPTGYTYNTNRDNCYKNYPGVIMDIDQGVYREKANCPIGNEYDPIKRKCLSEPKCEIGGTIDYSRKVCAKNETLTCNSGLSLTPGISFDTCNMATICPTGYTLDIDNVSCKKNIPCPNIDAANAVCYESEGAVCSSPTAVVEPSNNFYGFGVACADPKICYSGNREKIGGEWMCSDTNINVICSGKVDGWGEVLSCPAGTQKKWETNEYGSRKGPVCALNSLIVTNPLQDYQLDPTGAGSKLPEYNLWTGKYPALTCDRNINVLRCPEETPSMIYTPVYPDGEYTGHKGTLGSLQVACQAPILYAKNIWTESKSTVPAATWTCTNNSNNTGSTVFHWVPRADANTNQSSCSSGWHPAIAGVTGVAGVADNPLTPLINEYVAPVTAVAPVASYCDVPVQDWVYWYTQYTQGSYTCTNTAGTSSSSSISGGLGTMSGVAVGTCSGLYGTSGISYSDPSITGTVSYNSTSYNCASSLQDQGNFTWAESCPTGFVINTAPNGAITSIPSGSRTYNNRYSSNSSNFNDKRCYTPSALATGTDFVNNKYYITEFPIVTDIYSDYGLPACTTLGLDYSATLNKCISSRADCTGIFNEITGKCEKAPLSVSCSAGYTYNTARARCEKPFTCEDGATVNSNAKTCEKRITDPCVTQDIGGFDLVCSTNGVCQAGTTKIVFGGETYCKSTKMSSCPEGYNFDITTDKCYSPTYCEKGYVKEGNECVLNYNWSSYTCPTGWGDPIEHGADCHGECSFNGCWCNGSNAPANNCKQSLSINAGSNSFELFEKRPIEKHLVLSGNFSTDDFGEMKNFACTNEDTSGSPCLFDINKITGHGSDLCFEKGNNESTCFKVENCFFEGEIVSLNDNGQKKAIKHLILQDPHFLTSSASNASGSTCPGLGNLTYNYATGLCEGRGNFNDWHEEGEDLTQGDWTVLNNGSELYQKINGEPTFYISNIEYSSNVVFEGKMKSADADDDYIGMVFGWKNRGDFFAIDWKKGNNNPPTKRGLRLVRIHNTDYNQAATGGTKGLIKWGTPVTSPAVEILKSDFTYPGYKNNQWYTVKVEYTRKNVNLFLDGVKVLTYDSPTDIFPETGNIGFLNVSQAKVSYRDFFIKSNPLGGSTGVPETFGGIVSSCRLNGHVGWSGSSSGTPERIEGITSVALGLEIKRWLDINATGVVNLNDNNATTESASIWDGFNIGTMAVTLSDGNTYVSEHYKDSAGVEVDRNLPPHIRKLSNSNYFIEPQVLGEPAFKCSYLGKQTPGYCGNLVKIIMPEPKMTAIAYQDIESLNPSLGSKRDNNNFDLNITINEKSVPYKGRGVKQEVVLDKSFTSETDLSSIKNKGLADRIEFWDSFMDGDIGFLEFVRDVYNKDRVENFVPENHIPYEMSKKGFSSIKFNPDSGQTFFVSPLMTTAATCQEGASMTGGVIIDIASVPDSSKKMAYSLGGGNEGSCIIMNNKRDSFQSIDWAVRKNIYNGNFSYKCSPYICNTKNECLINTCPFETIGTPPELVEYQGTLLPPAYNEEGCRLQKCDGNKPLIDMCGRPGPCDSGKNNLEDNNQCFELYCAEGMLNLSKKSCQVLKCPFGFTETSNGLCTR